MPKIQVIGESCQDVFIYCEAIRLAPDIPVPVLQEKRVETNPGMAANVHRNIFTHVADCSLTTNSNWTQITKTRYIHDKTNHLFFRVDTPHRIDPINFSELEIDSDIVVISDYDKGFLTRSVIEKICSKHDLVFLDTKKILGSWARNAAYIKINDYEYVNSIDFITSEIDYKLIHTRGNKGCDFRGVNYPVEDIEVRDTSGAGDSFMAALVIEYLKHNNIIEAITMANIAATRVVKTRGVGII